MPSKLRFTPFTILIDDRERLPYHFAGIDKRAGIVSTQRKRLATGDYSILGQETEIMVERKSLEDLYYTLGQERERFENEFRRLSEAICASVVIEASWQEIAYPTIFRDEWRSQLDPNSVLGTIMKWSKRYPNVIWHICKNKEKSERKTYKLLRDYWMQKQKECEAKQEKVA